MRIASVRTFGAVFALLVGGGAIGFSATKRVVDESASETQTCLRLPKSALIQYDSSGLLVPKTMPVSTDKCGVFHAYTNTRASSEPSWESMYFASPDWDSLGGSSPVLIVQGENLAQVEPKAECPTPRTLITRTVGSMQLMICIYQDVSPELEAFWREVPFTDSLDQANWVRESA